MFKATRSISTKNKAPEWLHIKNNVKNSMVSHRKVCKHNQKLSLLTEIHLVLTGSKQELNPWIYYCLYPAMKSKMSTLPR